MRVTISTSNTGELQTAMVPVSVVNWFQIFETFSWAMITLLRVLFRNQRSGYVGKKCTSLKKYSQCRRQTLENRATNLIEGRQVGTFFSCFMTSSFLGVYLIRLRGWVDKVLDSVSTSRVPQATIVTHPGMLQTYIGYIEQDNPKQFNISVPATFLSTLASEWRSDGVTE